MSSCVPRRVASFIYICRCLKPYNVKVDGKPNKCKSCGTALIWDELKELA